MLFIDHKGNYDIRVNLAIEEYMLNHLDADETYLLFYISDPCVIVGRNQNTIEEINTDYVETNAFTVTRRLSGGGAVYNDKGVISYSFLTKDDGNSFNNFKKFTDPIVRSLQKLGANAELKGRNDIEIDGKKVSGTAQFSSGGKMFSHGTLLFNSNLDDVAKALKPRKDKIESKGVKSVRARVGNISDFINQEMTMEEFKAYLLKSIFEDEADGQVKEYVLSEEDWDQIYTIAETRYKNWDWVYGKSPKFNVQRSKRFPAGTVDVRFDVVKGKIATCKIFGDFFGMGEIKDVEEKLTGIRYERSEIDQTLQELDLPYYFGKIEKDELIRLFY